MIGKKKRKRNLEIPLDVMIEILLRLPARSIVRFRLACKLWRSETLNPDFIDAHLDLARKVRPPSILLLHTEVYQHEDEFIILSNSLSSLDLPICVETDSTTCHGSRNGIVCFSGHYNESIHLSNLTTGDTLRVPKDPVHNNDMVYFGFHPVTKEYSVVNVYRKDDFDSDDEMSDRTLPISGCLVYTIGTTRRSSSRSWREIDTIPDFLPALGFDAAELEGTMYFVSRGYTDSVVSLDLKDETFTQIPLPNFEIHKSESTGIAVEPRIVELEGNVCLAVNIAGCFDIWRLDVNGNKRGWMLMYSMKDMNIEKPLCIHGDKIVMVTHDVGLGGLVLCYLNIKDNFEYDGDLSGYGKYAYTHVESLVALPNQ